MTASAPLRVLDDLKRQRPEWSPWLDVVEVALRTSEEAVWADTVPQAAPSRGASPQLAGAILRLPRSAVAAYVERLLRTASRGGTGEMATLASACGMRLDAVALFQAALCHEPSDIAHTAEACGVHAGALQTVAALVPVPFLQACRRAWRARRDWMEPYCPLCGAWPAFAEVRGIERQRYYRCGRCGSDWLAHELSCPFCGTKDHRRLVRLMASQPLSSSAVDACLECRGYVKAFSLLQGCAPAAALLKDLDSVAVDLVAIEQGYSRPATVGYRLDATVTNP